MALGLLVFQGRFGAKFELSASIAAFSQSWIGLVISLLTFETMECTPLKGLYPLYLSHAIESVA